jgi:hypothetical protein
MSNSSRSRWSSDAGNQSDSTARVSLAASIITSGFAFAPAKSCCHRQISSERAAALSPIRFTVAIFKPTLPTCRPTSAMFYIRAWRSGEILIALRGLRTIGMRLPPTRRTHRTIRQRCYRLAWRCSRRAGIARRHWCLAVVSFSAASSTCAGNIIGREYASAVIGNAVISAR